MKKLLTLLTICFLGSNMLFSQGTVIYKNTFAGDAGTSPAETTPEINTITDFQHTATNDITLDGNGNIIWPGTIGGNFGSYKFRLDPTTPLNQNPALTGIKATIVLRTASRYIAITYGNLQPTINPTANNANTWLLAAATNFQIFGGEGAEQGGGVGDGAHAENDTITVEYIYRFDKKVTLISNGVPIVEGLSKPHTQAGAEADPSILWCMLTFQNHKLIEDENKRGFISELTIETLNDVWVNEITATGAGGTTEITTAGGTLQMSAAVLPGHATNSSVTWSVDNDTLATIDAYGLLTAKSDGEVNVIAKAADFSGVTDTLAVTISNQSTGIGPEDLLSKGLSIYPNPAGGVLNISSSGGDVARISIIDITGQIVRTMDNPGRDFAINLEGMVSGVYILKVQDYDANTVVRRILKQ